MNEQQLIKTTEFDLNFDEENFRYNGHNKLNMGAKVMYSDTCQKLSNLLISITSLSNNYIPITDAFINTG